MFFFVCFFVFVWGFLDALISFFGGSVCVCVFLAAFSGLCSVVFRGVMEVL